VTVICIKEGFVVRLDEFDRLVEHVDKCIQKLIASEKSKIQKVSAKLLAEADKERLELVNIAVRSLWPNRTHLSFKSLRGLLSTRLESKHGGRALFHSKRFDIMTGKSIQILPHSPTSTNSIVNISCIILQSTWNTSGGAACRPNTIRRKWIQLPARKTRNHHFPSISISTLSTICPKG
jgi:hypothetical protein